MYRSDWTSFKIASTRFLVALKMGMQCACTLLDSLVINHPFCITVKIDRELVLMWSLSLPFSSIYQFWSVPFWDLLLLSSKRILSFGYGITCQFYFIFEKSIAHNQTKLSLIRSITYTFIHIQTVLTWIKLIVKFCIHIFNFLGRLRFATNHL